MTSSSSTRDRTPVGCGPMCNALVCVQRRTNWVASASGSSLHERYVRERMATCGDFLRSRPKEIVFCETYTLTNSTGRIVGRICRGLANGNDPVTG